MASWIRACILNDLNSYQYRGLDERLASSARTAYPTLGTESRATTKTT